MGNVALLQKNEVKYLYLVIHLDKRLACAKRIKSKRKQPEMEMNALATR
jgi:hypothetical protein